ncbi:MAG: YihY family inner membrane protein [bacterium]
METDSKQRNSGSGNYFSIVDRLNLLWQFVVYLKRRFMQDGCQQSAAALTYMSLFAVVPLLTMMYAMFSMVPAFQGLGDRVQQLVFDNFVPQSGAEIQGYLLEFSTQARRVSAIGVVILALTSYLMLSNIEKTFNKIWGAAGARRGLSSFLVYWGVLSLGPILIGLGLLMQGYLVSFQLLVDEVDTLGLVAWIFEYLPLIMTWVAFALLFVAVPNCRVSFRYALAGGFLTTTIFEAAKWVFATAIANSNYTTIYGAFAVVPIFLIWVYVGWTIVLLGAEFVRALETFKAVWRPRHLPELVVILIVLWECWQRQSYGGEISDKEMLDGGLDQERWQQARDHLLKERVLAKTEGGRYVLRRDLHQLSVWQLSQIASGELTDMPDARALETLKHYPWLPKLVAMLESANDACREVFEPKVSELFSGKKLESKDWDAM